MAKAGCNRQASGARARRPPPCPDAIGRTVNIRGKDFFHERWASLGSRPFSDCVTSQMVQPDPIEPDEEGRLLLETTGLWFQASPDGGRVLMRGAFQTQFYFLLNQASLFQRRPLVCSRWIGST